jgi:hypothetical protein
MNPRLSQSQLPHRSLAAVLTALVMVPVIHASAVQVRVTFENLSPAGGTLLTPVWVGFHDGTFDLYDRDAAISPELERLAEDGNTAPLSAAFAASTSGGVDGTMVSGAFPPFAPGTAASMDFILNPGTGANRYLSFASMVIPSNDAFIANGNPMAIPLFDGNGKFMGADLMILGSMILDAGSEVNDELPVNTAFLGQAAPNTGTPEGGTVQTHPGFAPAGQGGILDGSFAGFSFGSADFKADGYQVARIRVTAVPEGTTVLTESLLAGSVLAFGLRFRRSRKA